jgi:hypothetical protein
VSGGATSSALLARLLKKATAHRHANKSERDHIEGDPAGLRMEAAASDRRPSGCSKHNQRDDPERVDDPDRHGANWQQHERRRETQFSAAQPEVDAQEADNQPDTLVARALRRDRDLEGWRADDEPRRIADRERIDQAKRPVDDGEGVKGERAPELFGDESRRPDRPARDHRPTPA